MLLSRIVPSLLVLSVLFLFSHYTAPTSEAACTHSWPGGNGDWFNPINNWGPFSGGSAPNASSDVCITASGTYTVVVPGNVSIRSLSIGAGKTLHVMGNGTFGNAMLSASSRINNSGTILLESREVGMIPV